MINNGSTGSAQVFLQSARELAARLQRDGSPEAEEMVAEAQTLAEAFRRWEIHRPENGVRLGTIKQLMDLNRRAMDYLTQSPNGRQ